MICAFDTGEKEYYFRLDRIRGIRLLDDSARSANDIPALKHNLSKHMAEHIYMFSGESVNVTFRVQVNAVGAVMDWLADARVRDCGDGFAMATVTVNENAMLYWALQYGMNVEVLEPAALRERVREAVCAMHEKYRGGDGLS